MLLITLQDLLVRPPSLDWFEAVAIVQAICAEALRGADGDGPAIPDRRAILLTPDGGVEFGARGRGGQAPVIVAAGLLNELLAPNRTPTQLRSLATATLDSPGRYSSLEQFSGALAYFDRPNREKVLRDVFERAQAAAELHILQPLDALGLDEFPSESPESSPPALQAAARPHVTVAPGTGDAASPPRTHEGTAASPVTPPAGIRHVTPAANGPRAELKKPVTPASKPAIEPVRRAGGPWPRWLPWRAVVVVGASSVLLVAIGMAMGRVSRTPGTAETRLAPPSAPPVFAAAAASPAWPLKPNLELEPDRDALVQGREGNSAARFGTGSVRAGSLRAGRPARDVAQPSTQAAPARKMALPPAPAAPAFERASSAAAVPNSSQDRREAAPELPSVDSNAKPGVAGSARAIYSAADTSVQPPVGIRQRYWTEPPPGIPAESLTRIEILVSEKGEVESTRIVSGPRSYFDGQILSAVKGWTFKPATLDGRPVAYRQQVWLLVAER